MARIQKIKLIQGLEANRLAFTPDSGEPLWVTDAKKLYIGDGATAGGIDIVGSQLTAYALKTSIGVANGIASLDASGMVPKAQIPKIALTDTFTVASEAAQLALVAQTGDVAIRTDLSKSFILQGTNPAVIGDWTELLSPTSIDLSTESINDLGDVNLTGLADKNYMYYDLATTKWVNGVLPSGVLASINEIGDVDTTTSAPTAGQVLKWDNTAGKWVPGTVASGGPATFVSLSDTPANYGGVTPGQILVANNGTTPGTPDGLTFTNTIDGGTF